MTRLPVLALVAAVPTSLGFVRKVWAFGIGYGLSLFASGTLLALCAPRRLPRAVALQALGATVHGLRLASYIFAREAHGGGRMPKDYIESAQAMEGDRSARGRLARLPLVATCASMYGLLMSPIALAVRHAEAAEEGALLPRVGAALQWTGLLLSAVADWQKHQFKRKRGGAQPRWCDTGLYRCARRWLHRIADKVAHQPDNAAHCAKHQADDAAAARRYSRHPNYAGELLFWSGAFVAGVRSFRGLGEWALAGAGLASAWATMLGATRRLEARQAARYGAQEAYTRYLQRTGALLPRLPRNAHCALRMPRLRLRCWPPPADDR